MKTFALALATMMTGCVAMTAHATAPARNVYQQVVSYADLNLESEFDAGILLGRIKSAARKVCGLRNLGTVPLAITDRLENCASDATARAVAEVNAPLLTQALGSTVRPTVVARNERGEVEIRVATRSRM